LNATRLLAVLCALAAWGGAAPARADENRAAAAREALERSRRIASLLAQVAERYRRLPAFRVRFVQQFESGVFGADERETGTIHVQRPRRMLWLYDRPAGRRGVFDGASWWLLDPEERQVTRHDPAGDDLVIELLTGRLEPGQAFAIESAGEEEGAGGLRRVRLVPRQPRDDLDAVIVAIDPETLDLREIDVIDPLGSRWVYRFGPVEPAAPLPESAFHVTIPPGWTVVRM